MFLDSHCHLDDPSFDADREKVIDRAREAGLRYLLDIGTDPQSACFALDLANRHDFIYAAAAVHPHDASSADENTISALRDLYSHPKMLGIGETGLDFYYDNSPRERQEEVFRRFLRLGLEFDKPVIIHLRDPKEGLPLARKRFFEILDEECPGKLKGIMHCFTGDHEFAQRCVERGLMISIPGVVTFPKAAELHEAVRRLPYRKLLIETDCPYLAPVPKRGKRNEPAFVIHTAEKVAELKNITCADLDRILNYNFETFFGLRKPGPDVQDTIAYEIRGNLYLNLTNRCTCNCTFCDRTRGATVSGYHLGLRSEPTAAQLIAAAGDPTRYRQVIFCGYGEPTIRLDTLKEVASALKTTGASTRLNTNGHADLIHGRDILPELVGLIDTISVSLNAATEEDYERLCIPDFGDAAFEAVKRFIRRAVELGFEVVASAVELPGLDLEPVSNLAESLGAKFRVRFYNVVG
jgi:TatD DNase family protein